MKALTTIVTVQETEEKCNTLVDKIADLKLSKTHVSRK